MIILIDLHRGTKKRYRRTKKYINSVIRNRKRLLDTILEFRVKIQELVPNKLVKEICLKEIDEVLQFKMNKKDVEVESYYLWEQAGRPHGRHEEFWLEAEKKIWMGENEKRT